MFLSQEQYQNFLMHMKANNDIVFDFIKNLDAEECYALWLILRSVQEDHSTAGPTLGIVMGQLRYQHEACMCGEQVGFHTEMSHLHDKSKPSPAMEKLVEAVNEKLNSEADNVTIETHALDPVVYDAESGVTWSPRTWALGDAELSQEIVNDYDTWLDRYHLAVKVLPDSKTTGTYYCTRCKNEYPSITDRMQKGPENCQYCHIMQARGGMSPFE